MSEGPNILSPKSEIKAEISRLEALPNLHPIQKTILAYLKAIMPEATGESGFQGLLTRES